MEKYDYEIEYFKGKENKVANCLSRLFPVYPDTIKQSKDNVDSTLEQLVNALPDTEIFKMGEPSEDPQVQKVNTLLFDQFIQWRLQPINSDKIIIKNFYVLRAT